jgi:hypothetical protein
MSNIKSISSSPFLHTFVITMIIGISIYIVLIGTEKFLTKMKTEKLKDLNIHHIWYQKEYPHSDEAADKLIDLFKKVNYFLSELESKHPNNPDIARLISRMKKGIKIQESEDEDGTSSYTINKGEILSFCLRHKDDQQRFHNDNTMWFVICHELSHVMSVSEGHNGEFIKNFRFLLKESQLLGIYTPVDYSNNNIKYCGVLVTSNPYF